MMLSKYLRICICYTSLSLVTGQYLPDSQSLIIKELEHLYLDSAANGLMTAITPCSNYIDPATGQSNNGLGGQTAAEWIRVAFRNTPSSAIFAAATQNDTNTIHFFEDNHTALRFKP